MAFTVEINGLEDLKRAFKQYPNIARPRMRQALTASVAELRKHTGRETVAWRTGALASTFNFRVGDGWASYFPTRHYAPHVEFGTRYQRAKPYMQKIINRAQPGINGHFATALGRITADIAKKI